MFTTNGYYVRISLLLSCSSSSLSTRCTMAPRGGFKPRRRAGWSAKKLREMPVLRSVPGLRPLQLFPLAGRLYDFMRRRVAERLLRIGTDEAMEDLVFHFLTDHGEKFWVFDHEICGYDHMYGEYVFPIPTPTPQSCTHCPVGLPMPSSMFLWLFTLVFLFVVALRRSNTNNNHNHISNSSRRRMERTRMIKKKT